MRKDSKTKRAVKDIEKQMLDPKRRDKGTLVRNKYGVPVHKWVKEEDYVHEHKKVWGI